MKKWIDKRVKDPTTYLGIALIVEGVGNLAKVEEASGIAASVHAAAPSFTQGDVSTGLVALLMGILGVFFRKRA